KETIKFSVNPLIAQNCTSIWAGINSSGYHVSGHFEDRILTNRPIYEQFGHLLSSIGYWC
ncbi:MAG TPA: hypothetical protein VNZ45_15385, partial [Bacteroidia bacterium]|nr:hypothetical protein [Bacteroidia bacterium]